MIPYRDDIRARYYPLVTMLIIAANAAVFCYQLTLTPQNLGQLIDQYGLVPADFQLSQPSPHLLSLPGTLFTSMFLHAGWGHLLVNMWFLWIFGDKVEDRMGHVRFLVFYLASGLFAGFLYVLTEPHATLPVLGSSFPVAAVLGAYLASYPLARVLTLVPLILIWPVIELPAVLVLATWFPLQLLNNTATLTGSAAGTAWGIVILAFLAGMALIRLFVREPLQRYSW